jgi:aspartyl-tRNA(Asn)/glutamyl-tRNA(Gln) amidotransferase subunit A
MKLPKTIEEARKGLIRKKFSCLELAKFYLEKIKKENKKYNNFLNLTEKLALEQAKKVDDKISRREKIGPLEGIPLAIKDNILVEDYPTTAGSRFLKNYIAPYDATVIKKLKQAGVVIVGKTNLDEFAMGSSTENSAFGVVKNPYDTSRVPGGSSGGSAVAVAADHCLGALGSDTGGSVRQPASFCGVVGFKPSYGMVSRYGLIAMASSLDQIGPIAKTIEDAKLIFDAIRGKDERDSTAVQVQKSRLCRGFGGQAKAKSRNLRIGIPKEYFGRGLDKGVREKIEKAIEDFEKKGAKIRKVSLPFSEYALAVYYIIMPAEVSANLARYDGIKYGFSRKGDLLNQYLKTRAQGFGDEVRRRIMLGTYVLSAGYWEAYYGKAQKVRELIKKEFEKVFKEVDVLLTPTAPSPAFKIGEKKDPLSMYLSDIYTVPVNLAGLPAISVPCGEVKGLPIGLQIIGPQFKDDLVFEVAMNYGQ